MGLLDRFRKPASVPMGFTAKTWKSLQSAMQDVSDRTNLNDCVPRKPILVGGMVIETTAQTEPSKQFSVRLTDGTAEVTLTWLGRNCLPGVAEGVFLVARGTVAHTPTGTLQMFDPQYSIQVSEA